MMKRTPVGVLTGGAFALIATHAALGHHSVGAEFDVDKTIRIEGTIASVEWLNPHIWLYIDVEAADGSTARYQCEGSSPNSLRRRGWTRDSLRPGDRVEIEGLEARRDPYTCYTRAVRLADGQRLFSGSADELER